MKKVLIFLFLVLQGLNSNVYGMQSDAPKDKDEQKSHAGTLAVCVEEAGEFLAQEVKTLCLSAVPGSQSFDFKPTGAPSNKLSNLKRYVKCYGANRRNPKALNVMLQEKLPFALLFFTSEMFLDKHEGALKIIQDTAQAYDTIPDNEFACKGAVNLLKLYFFYWHRVLLCKSKSTDIINHIAYVVDMAQNLQCIGFKKMPMQREHGSKKEHVGFLFSLVIYDGKNDDDLNQEVDLYDDGEVPTEYIQKA